MKATTLTAHFDGERIQLDEPFALRPHARLLVTVLPGTAAESEREIWGDLASHGLAGAYGPDEPEYSLDLLKEKNPEYDRG
ncbi:MAG: hypothetical protein GY719_23820 [bacterium]|nr:hypothetical protein [bacterium]